MAKLDPSTGVRVRVEAQRTAVMTPASIELDMEFAHAGGEGPTPYEMLLHAALIADSQRFKREGCVEEAWRVMQPLLDAPPPVHPYAEGPRGPTAAEDVVAGNPPWHEPWRAS